MFYASSCYNSSWGKFMFKPYLCWKLFNHNAQLISLFYDNHIWIWIFTVGDLSRETFRSNQEPEILRNIRDFILPFLWYDYTIFPLYKLIFIVFQLLICTFLIFLPLIHPMYFYLEIPKCRSVHPLSLHIAVYWSQKFIELKVIGSLPCCVPHATRCNYWQLL